MICKICNQNMDNNRKLSKHIRDYHKNIDVKKYYDDYIKTEIEGKCVICTNPTKYSNLGLGYSKTCSHSCSAKLFRFNLKLNEEKYDTFKQKISNNMIKEWKKREKTGEKYEIIEKAKKTKKETIENMSYEERIKKFGWINKLNESEKQKFIQKNYWEILYKYWQEITDEQFMKITKKRLNTMSERQKSDYVYLITEKDKEIIDNKLKELLNIK